MKLSYKKYKLKAKTIDILKGVKIKTPEETLDKLINENCSISRLGDGEFDLIWGIDIQYQNVNDKLVKKLREILESNEDKLLIGINNAFDLDYINKYNDFAKNYWKGWLKDNKYRVLKLLSKKKQYYSALISRFYIDYEDKSSVSEYVEKLKKLWDKKDVLVVEGEFSRLGVGNDLFNSTNSIQRIICPSENAFDEYDEILKKILEYGKNKLILLALAITFNLNKQMVLGLVFGTLIAILNLKLLAITINKTVSMPSTKAQIYSSSQYLIRMAIMAVVLFVSAKKP